MVRFNPKSALEFFFRKVSRRTHKEPQKLDQYALKKINLCEPWCYFANLREIIFY
jgi:hypothetical protein